MANAYILITTKSGSEKEVLAALKKSENVTDAQIVYGEYDLVVKVEVDDITKLNEFLLESVRTINGIKKTSTVIVAS